MLSVQDGLTEPHQEVQYRSNLCSEARDGEESSWNEGQEIHGDAPQETETQEKARPAIARRCPDPSRHLLRVVADAGLEIEASNRLFVAARLSQRRITAVAKWPERESFREVA